MDVDDLVADQRLEEDADESHKPILHVPVLDGLTGGYAVGDVEVNKFRGQLYGRCEPVNHLH